MRKFWAKISDWWHGRDFLFRCPRCGDRTPTTGECVSCESDRTDPSNW